MFKKYDTIIVEVTALTSYGVFVKVDDYTGLIHISEISDKYVKDINSFALIGDKVKVYVLDVNEENKQLKLSYKRCKSGKKIIIPELEIGFKTLEDKLPEWINEASKK